MEEEAQAQAKSSKVKSRGAQAERSPEGDRSIGRPIVEAFGDTALRIVFGASISPSVQRKVRNFMTRLERDPLPGMIEAVPAFASVAVFYDPLRAAEALSLGDSRPESSNRSVRGDRAGVGPIQASAAEWIECLLGEDNEGAEDESRLVEIPVIYGGDYGPDLAFVAEQAGLTPEEVIRLHTEREYPVYMIGFAPGFPYLGGIDERIAAPRLDTPRLSVPAGAVGIAGGQTGVYPVSTPGGWRLIGRTPIALFRPERTPPSLLRAGDRVRFRPVTAAEYERRSLLERAEREGSAEGDEAEAEFRAGDARASGGEKTESRSGDADACVGTASARQEETDSAVFEAQPAEREVGSAADSGSMTAAPKLEKIGIRVDTQTAEPQGESADAVTSARVITVLKPGLLTTLQDLGRPGYLQYGVTPGGAMDPYALRAANLMVGNGASEAALEITLAGPALRFERETLIALTGADLAPSIGGEPLPMWRPVRVRAGAVLEFRTAVTGCRAYLAAAGGFGAPEALGSRSTDLRAGLGGLEGRALRAGDVLQTRTSAGASGAFGPLRAIPPGADFAAAAVHAAHGYLVGRPDWADVPAGGFASPAAAEYPGSSFDSAAESGRLPQQDPDPAVSGLASSTEGFRRRRSDVPAANPGLPTFSFATPGSSPSPFAPTAANPTTSTPTAPNAPTSTTIRFTRGTHFDLFDEPSRQALLQSAFRVEPQSDRMGCRLAGPVLRLSRPLEMISEAVVPGTVQVPPGGNPIILAADRQTTGGYPRIAQIAAVDLRILGQLRPGQMLRFVEITLEEAERLHIERERELERLRVAWRLYSRG